MCAGRNSAGAEKGKAEAFVVQMRGNKSGDLGGLLQVVFQTGDLGHGIPPPPY